MIRKLVTGDCIKGVTMDEEEFRKFLKRGGKSHNTLTKYVTCVKEFEHYLEQHKGNPLNEAHPEDLENFVSLIEKEPKSSAKTHLLGIAYYYKHVANEEMHHTAQILRDQRIKRTPFALKDFQGINPEYVEKLASSGIRNINQMLDAGKTHKDRQEFSQKTGIPLVSILEFVKLSDLARIPGVKSIRARLYHDAGIDTVEKIAELTPEELQLQVTDYIERTGFNGTATLPAEAQYTVKKAKELPKIVEY